MHVYNWRCENARYVSCGNSHVSDSTHSFLSGFPVVAIAMTGHLGPVLYTHKNSTQSFRLLVRVPPLFDGT